MRILTAVLSSALLAGCTTAFSSSSLIRPVDRSDAIGISYSLPRAVIGMRVLAVASNAQIVACVREPIAVADPGQQYFMQFQNSPFSADQFVVKRNELLGTLQEIDLKAQDQFDQFVINLGASAGAISGLRYQNSLAGICTAPPENTYELGDVEFDPVNKADYERNVFNINAAAVTFIQERLRECRGKNAPLSKQACREYERLYRTPDEDVEYVDEQTGQKRKMKTKPIVRMAWVLPKIPTPVAQARCEVGFCYRHTLPHTLHLIVGSSSVYSYTFQLPNSSPIVSLDLTRAIAVTKTTKISFGRLGEITQIEVKKGHGDAATGVVTDGAEAVELALLPQAVINAYFTSLKGTTDIIANMFTSETTAINNRKQLIDAEVALANAKKSAAGGRPTPQSSVTDSRGFVLAASNAVPRPKTQLRDSGEGKDSQEHDAQAGQAPPVATGAGGTGVGPGGAIPKKE